MDANIKAEVDKERERIMSELMEYSYAGLIKVAVFKLKGIIYPPENLMASSGCACGGECGCK